MSTIVAGEDVASPFALVRSTLDVSDKIRLTVGVLVMEMLRFTIASRISAVPF
ncbi:MAG: hypothetical protein WD401_00315 [Thermomicrobiaceae bacterium]